MKTAHCLHLNLLPFSCSPKIETLVRCSLPRYSMLSDIPNASCRQRLCILVLSNPSEFPVCSCLLHHLQWETRQVFLKLPLQRTTSLLSSLNNFYTLSCQVQLHVVHMHSYPNFMEKAKTRRSLPPAQRSATTVATISTWAVFAVMVCKRSGTSKINSSVTRMALQSTLCGRLPIEHTHGGQNDCQPGFFLFWPPIQAQNDLDLRKRPPNSGKWPWWFLGLK